MGNIILNMPIHFQKGVDVLKSIRLEKNIKYSIRVKPRKPGQFHVAIIYQGVTICGKTILNPKGDRCSFTAPETGTYRIVMRDLNSSRGIVDLSVMRHDYELKSTIQAEQEYRNQQKLDGDELEKSRKKLINRGFDLFHRVIVELPMGNGQNELVTRIDDSLHQLFNVKKAPPVKTIELTFRTVKSNLDLYHNQRRDRTKNKRLALFVALFILGGALIANWHVATHQMQNGFWLFNLLFPFEVQNIRGLGFPWIVLFWSLYGSATAILYRFNTQSDVEMQDSFRWLFTRPVTGIIMGVILYFTFDVGIDVIDISGIESIISDPTFAKLLAFTGGFSDRLQDATLNRLIIRLSGDSADSSSPLNQIDTPIDFVPAGYSSPKSETPNEPEDETDDTAEQQAESETEPVDAENVEPKQNGKAAGAMEDDKEVTAPV